jgi:hypothetical protein
VGVRGSVVGWGTTLQAGRSRDRIPDEVGFFSLPNSSSRTMALGSTQLLTEMSTRNIHGGKGRPARKADNFTAICEPTVYKMWEPQHLTALWVSTARYRDTFTFYSSEVTSTHFYVFPYKKCRKFLTIVPRLAQRHQKESLARKMRQRWSGIRLVRSLGLYISVE